MIWTMATISALFLGPFAVIYIVTAIQIRRLEHEERKLRKINELEQKYGIEISNADLMLSAKKGGRIEKSNSHADNRRFFTCYD